MSKIKAFLPETYVLGSSPVLDHDPKLNRIVPVVARETMKNPGHGDVPYCRVGDPVWRKPKPTKLTQHFVNAAAKTECIARAAKKFRVSPRRLTRLQVLSVATPKELKIVPIYRGIPMRIANEFRAMQRRKEVLKETKERRKKAKPQQPQTGAKAAA